jgi:hypothetical protein
MPDFILELVAVSDYQEVVVIATDLLVPFGVQLLGGLKVGGPLLPAIFIDV